MAKKMRDIMTAAMFQQSALEKEIKGNVRTYLRWKGWKVIYNKQGMGSEPGIADVLIVKKGRHIMIETKTIRNNQFEKQKIFQRDWEAHGGEYMLVRSVQDLIDAGL